MFDKLRNIKNVIISKSSNNSSNYKSTPMTDELRKRKYEEEQYLKYNITKRKKGKIL